MLDCTCGKPVRLSAIRITVNRHRGVAHAILHMGGDSKPCPPGDWTCAAIKPYPKDKAQHESSKLIARWNEAVTKEDSGK